MTPDGFCVLAVTNASTREVNNLCTQIFSGRTFVCYSADSVFEPEDSCRYPTEFLNALSLPGVPEHQLVLKIGMPVVLLRNLNPKLGLCNGVRLTVTDVVNERLLCVKLASNPFGETFLIPRISIIVDDTKDVPCKWRRRQFPVMQAFSMTINKVQGQTLDRVAVWLEQPVFSHGQFYTAASRVRNPENIRFYVNEDHDATSSVKTTRNFVYREALN